MAEQRDRARRRETFGLVPELYDRARPSYPAVIFDDMAEIAGLAAGARVLEIGPGTGKATAELVRRGYAVTAVELAAPLAEVARRNVPGATVEIADFETWDPAGREFDAVTSFAAFHWIAPEVRCTKPAQILRPGGALAVVSGVHVLPPDGDHFFADAQEDYNAVVPHPDNRPPPPPDDIENWFGPEVRDSGVFETVVERRHLDAVTYTADEYIALLGTFSDNLVLPPEQREELFGRIHRRIEAAGGTVTKHSLLLLTVGQRPKG